MNHFYLGLLFFISINVFGQISENIITDRPDQSEGTYVIPSQRFQFENGIVYTQNDFAYEFMLRYGLSKNNEIRLESDLAYSSKHLLTNILVVSVKQQISQQKKYFPAVTIVGYMGFDYESKKINPDLLLALEQDFEKFYFVMNIGSKKGFQNGIYTFQTGFPITSKTTFYSEYFLIFSEKSSPNHGFDTGLLYILKPNLQLDLSAGINYENANWVRYISSGISILFR